MAARGAYRKGIEKREEILRLALEVLAREGYRGTTIRDVADAVGLSQTGLLHYFGSKDELLTAVLRRRDEIDSEDEEGLSVAERLIRTLRHNATVPGLVMLYAQRSAGARRARPRPGRARRAPVGADRRRGARPDVLAASGRHRATHRAGRIGGCRPGPAPAPRCRGCR